MIETRSLSFGYLDSGIAVSEASLTIPAGRLVTVIGPNGSGKSTLLRLLARVLRPGRGEILLDGRPASSWSGREWARMVGYLPQDIEPSFPMRAVDAVRSGLAAWLPRFGFEGDAETRRALAALARLDAAGLAERLMGEMSGGERKRVLLARVLVGEPRILLLDEPLSSLDVAHVAQLGRQLRSLTAEGMTVVVVAHDFLWTSSYSDLVVVMKEGRIAGAGEPLATLTGELITDVFGVESLQVRDADGRSWILPGIH